MNYQELYEECYGLMSNKEKSLVDIRKSLFLENSDFMYYNLYEELMLFIKTTMPHIYLEAFNKTAKRRVYLELEELESKLEKLCLFMRQTIFTTLSKTSQLALREQRAIMQSYIAVLKYRLKNWEDIK